MNGRKTTSMLIVILGCSDFKSFLIFYISIYLYLIIFFIMIVVGEKSSSHIHSNLTTAILPTFVVRGTTKIKES